MNIKEIKLGAIFSYGLIIVNTFYGLFFIPFLISSLGDGEYGVYRIIGSFIGSITILDLGIGSTILRYVAKFHAQNEKDKLNNFSAMGMIQAAILSAGMIIVSLIMYSFLDTFYSESLTATELAKAKQLFGLFIIILVMNTFEKVLFGIISGCEHYAFANSLKLGRLVSKLLISYIVISRINNSAYLLYINISILAIVMFFQIIYIKRIIGIRIKYHYWDMKLFRSTMKYTLLMFIQSIAMQLNGNIDNMVIGSVINATTVAVYSVGLQLFAMFEQFAVVLSDLMLPTVSKQVVAKENNQQLEDTVIKVGRFQFMALGAALCGYIIIGREFIDMWLGESYSMAWVVGLILMVPVMIPLVQNVCLSILRAQNRMVFRTVILIIMAVFNLIITVIGVKLYGPLAASVGTAAGLILANIIAMNIYYVKVIKLNVIRIFKEIFSRIWICCAGASAVLIAVNNLISGSWLIWFAKVTIFIIVYSALLMIFGLKNNEKNILFGKIYTALGRKAKK